MDLVAYEIKIPYEMKTFLEKPDKKTELQINAMLLYPSIIFPSPMDGQQKY